MEKLYESLLETYKTRPHREYEEKAKLVKKEIVDKDFHFEYKHFIPYPTYQNKRFNEIIYKKQEFHRNKSHWEDGTDYDAVVQDKCAGEFRATPNQKFLKNFMSPMTPYKSLLIFHHVGTGKTCSAINIAEQYYDTFDRRVLVVLSENIEDNFKKQIFDINKATQCTGTKYPDMVADKHLLTKTNLDDKVKAIIKKRYEFMGYKKLANYLINFREMVKEQVKDPKDPSKLREIELRRETLFKEAIREKFSNRLIIVDEAHNLRLSSEKGNKQISAAFKELLEIAENVKLVMMTATPMYNIADEIVWMINLLLTNDRAKTVTRADLFDKESNLTEKGKQILKDISRGYVSYMRGENPFSFPIRLWPSTNNPKDPNLLVKYPVKDIYNQPIPEDTKVKFLEIITSKMSDYQYEVYNSFKRKIKDDTMEDIEDDNENNDVQNTMQVSNVVYPLDKWDAEPRKTYGSTGFQNCFDVISKSKVFRVKYKDNVKAKFGEFLSYAKLPKYAPKFKTIIDYIKNAKGIVFIYSRYYWAGLYPLACALEHAGMTRFSSDQKDRRVIDNITISDQFNGKKPKYIILSTNEDLSPNNNLEIELAKTKENIDGSRIKVIIVSKIGTEGIDFKRIREVHVLEPWYNLNRAEQIIGRAVRTCSHIDLPKEHRNVTIYFHANICNDQEESVDLRTYRICETKQKHIIDVETILKQNAVDCNLNKNILMFLPKRLKTRFNIETAQGKLIKDYEMGDKDFSFVCGFKKCNTTTHSDGSFICDPGAPEAPTLDDTTFDVEFISDDISLMKKYIVSLYVKDLSPRTYVTILKELKTNYKLIEDDIVSFALEEMVEHKYVFRVAKGSGYLLYKSDKYIFQYENLLDVRMALEDRADLETRNKRLELNVNKIMRKIKVDKIIEPTMQTPTKEEPKTDITALYESCYENMVIFFLDVETEDISKLKTFLDTKTTMTKHEEVIFNYLKKEESNSVADGSSLTRINDQLTKYNKIVCEAVIDRLKINDLFEVFNKKEEYKDLYKAMESSDLVVNEFIVNPVDKKLYKLKNGKVTECTFADYVAVKDKYNKIKEKMQTKLDKSTKLYNIWQSDKLVFKIRDKETTLGAVCGTSSKKDYLAAKIMEIYGKSPKFNHNKQTLCFIIEVLSRKAGSFQRALYINKN